MLIIDGKKEIVDIIHSVAEFVDEEETKQFVLWVVEIILECDTSVNASLDRLHAKVNLRFALDR